jgi:hypothetical protein
MHRQILIFVHSPILFVMGMMGLTVRYTCSASCVHKEGACTRGSNVFLFPFFPNREGKLLMAQTGWRTCFAPVFLCKISLLKMYSIVTALCTALADIL